ncbi:MAG: glycosyltransferase family 39 protein [Patescibacteria group bacterium]
MIRNFIERHKVICAIISVAIIAHLALFFALTATAKANPTALHHEFPIPGGGYDPIDYTTLARHILTYGNFSMEPGVHGDAETYRSPGYPFFIAVVEYLTDGIKAVTLFQIVLIALTALVVYLLVLEVSPGSRKTAIAVATLFVFDPVIFFSSQFIATEALYAFLFLLAIYFLVKKTDSPLRMWALAGFTLGLSALARPSGFYMSIPIGIWILIRLWRVGKGNRKPLLKKAVIFFVGLCLVVTTWTIRNGVRTSVYEFSSLSTYNTMFNIPVYLSYKDKRSIEDIRADLDQKMGGLTDTEKRDSRNGPLMRKIEKDILLPNLPNYLFFHISKSINFFVAPGSKFAYGFLLGFWDGQPIDTWHPETSFVNSLIEGRWRDVGRVLYQNIVYFPESLFLLIMCAFGLYWSLFSRNPYAKLIFGMVVFLALLTSPITNPRYRVPVLPFIYFSGIAGITLVLEKRSLRRSQRPLTPSR